MPKAVASRESIIVWTDEERRYLRRLLSHDFSQSSDEARRAPPGNRTAQDDRKPAGEFKVLVLGAKGTGKTSVLTRICQNRMPNPGEHPRQAHRTAADVDSTLYAFTLHDIPSSHLFRDDLIHQSIAATDATLLLYSISDPPSLRVAQGLAELIAESATASGRPYAILLAGNKSDLSTERRVEYLDGSRVAARVVGGVGVRTSFMEVSALGEQVEGLLPRIGADVLFARGVCEQKRQFEELARREEEGRRRRSRKRGLWERFSRSLFVRRVVA